MPSGQEKDWAYSITTVPGTHTGWFSDGNLQKSIAQNANGVAWLATLT